MNLMGKFEGYLDSIDLNTIIGWAWDKNNPNTPIEVDIYDSDILLAKVSANIFRTDLLDANIGDGRHGFFYNIPFYLKNGKEHTILVKFSGTKIDLINSPMQILLMGRFEGYLEKINLNTISGWAWDKNNPNTPIKVDIYNSDILLAKVSANIFRPDLLDANIGNGRHGFLYNIPSYLKNGKKHTILVKFSGTKINLINSPRTSKILFDEKYANILKSLLESEIEPWYIDDIQFTDTSIKISGWALAPQDNHSIISFMINNKNFDNVEYPLFREDIGKVFWYFPQAEKSGFICKLKIRKDKTFVRGHFIFKCINSKTKQPFRTQYNLFYHKDNIILPSPERRVEIHGNTNELSFRIEGYSTYIKLELALKKLFHKVYNDFSNILDWGCGCGRITRYFKYLKNALITGVDIDSDNIQWCKENLRFGHFLNISKNTPTNLEDAHFDLILGISIFTHLKEKNQYDQLSELRRISSDKAILLMSIHSNMAICRSYDITPIDFSAYKILKKKGIISLHPKNDPNNVPNIYHSRDYIIKNWSKYFKIVEIIPAYIGNLQDLVVMRKL